MPSTAIVAERFGVTIEIGELPIRLYSNDLAFLKLLRERYAGFISSSRHAMFEFDVDLVAPGRISESDDVRVTWDLGSWRLERNDFRAEWNPGSASGYIRQTANPYSIDSVLRILHTLLLAEKGGFLVHASSAVRNGKAFLFAGVSGAGKTTMARLAPADATLLTDEISYVTRQGGCHYAYGTPFVGELARVGANLCAPISALYLLRKGPENKLENVTGTEAARGLLESILFFAKDPKSVKLVFQAACDFVSRVPIHRLTFTPDARVWEMVA